MSLIGVLQIGGVPLVDWLATAVFHLPVGHVERYAYPIVALGALAGLSSVLLAGYWTRHPPTEAKEP